jgi:hypothetical protein
MLMKNIYKEKIIIYYIMKIFKSLKIRKFNCGRKHINYNGTDQYIKINSASGSITINTFTYLLDDILQRITIKNRFCKKNSIVLLSSSPIIDNGIIYHNTEIYTDNIIDKSFDILYKNNLYDWDPIDNNKVIIYFLVC